MRVAERRIRVHDHVDLGDQPGARVVDADGVDALDGGRVRQADVRDELLHLDAGRDAHEELELLEGRVGPDADDEEGQDDGAQRIDPPGEFGAADRRQDTEAVDQEIVAVVLPQDVDLAVLVLDAPAIQEQDELGAEGNSNRNDGWQVEAVGGRVGALVRGEGLNGEGDEDERDAAHEEAKGDVAHILETGLAGGEAVGVDALDGAVGEDEGQVAEGVEDGVGGGGEERERHRGDGGVELQGG